MTWLAVLALVLTLVLTGALIVVLIALRAVRRRTRELRGEVTALTPLPALSPDLDATFGSGERRLIVIEILNPLEVATQRVKAARLAGAMAPDMVRRLVVDEAAKEVVEQLAAQGVEATVSVHAAR